MTGKSKTDTLSRIKFGRRDVPKAKMFPTQTTTQDILI
jgi:hypothetical protein